MRNFFILATTLLILEHVSAEDDPPPSPPNISQHAATNIPTQQVFEQNLATLAGEPSAIVNGCVNVITGSFIDSAIDLCVPGPDPLFINRIYTNTSGWNINEPETVEFKSHKHPIVTHTMQGMISTYSEAGEKHKIRPENYRHGLTNCSTNFISGRSNPHNLEMKVKLKEKHFTLKDGTKAVKQFEKEFTCSRKTGKNTAEQYFAYGLAYEQKPHGIRTIYHYQNSPLGWAIQETININSLFQLLNSIKFDYSANFKINPCMIASANQGVSGRCEYKFEGLDPRFLREVLPSGAPKTQYAYDPKSGFMKRKILPGNQIMEIDYYDETNPFITVKDKEHSHYGHVFCLRAPVGKNQQPQTTHRFFYEIYRDKHSNTYGTTRVFDAHNQETRYSYDANSLLKSIEEVGAKSRTQKFFWYDRNTDFDGNLMTKVLQEANGKIFSCRHYIYDIRGNILENLLFGNLTGRDRLPVIINALGVPLESGCERYCEHCEYSDDGYNHVKSENDGRKITSYLYPNTDFLQAKFIHDLDGKIRYREFYSYNLNGSVIKLISDDGSGTLENDLSHVTERHITYIQYREQLPIGLPQIIEEKYLNLSTKKEELIKKVENFHDAFGQIVKQDFYDAKGQFRYSLKYEYDAHGNILQEVDPLGNTSTYSYDENDSLITEQYPGTPFYTRHTYDHANRLTCSEDVHPSFTLTSRQEYNFLNQKTSTIDCYGHETNFEYDNLGRLTKTTYPVLFNEDHSTCRPYESYEYDVANNPMTKIDLLGYRTDILYNIRGQPYNIRYYDGTEEYHEYTLDGLLEKSIAINGTSTHIDYDYLGRPIKTALFAPSGELLIETSTHYNHFHKQFELDPAGHRTDYQYDVAGRLICITKGDEKSVFVYDSCQRVAKTLKYFGPGEKDYIAYVQDFDLMDRVVEERTEDANENILTRNTYAYNERSERIQSITYHQTKPAITRFQYNAYGDIETVTDPEGNTTRHRFYYGHLNPYGQSVFAKESIDPLGNSVFIENDPYGRLKFEIRKDQSGTIQQKREFFYDLAGNCIKQIDHVFTPSQPERQVITIFEYDGHNNLIKQTEALGTPEQKQTQHVFNSYLQKIAFIKPDAVELLHAYDWLGRLTSFKASDQSFHYQYVYDNNSNVIRVDDIKNGTATHRIFDSNDRMIEETLANGLTTGYVFDGLTRPLQITLPDKSLINYKYKSVHLSQVQRGKHTHTYTKYNLSGLLESAKLIGSTGNMKYTIDACQRLIGIASPKWSEEIPQGGFDKAGNLIKKNTKDALGVIKGNFSYNSLYQLTSEIGVAVHNFIYDSLYNLIKKDGCAHTINSLNQLLHDGLEDNTYDLNGNLTHKGLLKLSYDALDRLISVDDGHLVVTYAYDELNRRSNSTYYRDGILLKSFDYIYQGQNEIGACDPSGKIIQLRVLGLGKGAEIGAAVLLELNGKPYVPIHDISGNVCALVNPQNGASVETYRYSAYGQEELYDAACSSISSSKNPWRFASKRTG